MAKPIDDDTLQRYYDGDLSPLEASSVRAAVLASPAAQKRLDELARLSEMMKVAAEEVGAGLDADALFADIRGGLEKDARGEGGERLRVITSEWLEHKRGMVAPFLGGLAVAAAALLIVNRTSEPEPSGGEAVAREAPLPKEERRTALASRDEVQGSRVEDVDFGDSTGTVFEIESQGVATAVVWISDEEELP